MITTTQHDIANVTKGLAPLYGAEPSGIQEYTPTGEYFERLLGFFPNVATPYDAMFIRAMFMTPLCTVAPGERPAFAIMGLKGHGKSALTQAVGELYNGAISMDLASADFRRLTARSTFNQRVVCFDDIKGDASNNALAELLTCKHIVGRPLFGQSEIIRSNTLTYVLNGINMQLSKDMASRCFFIFLTEPDRTQGSWHTLLFHFIQQYQAFIWHDIIAELHKPFTPCKVTERWQPFINEVLSRCTNDPVTLTSAILLNQHRR